MTEETTKRNTKYSVFVDLFSDESNVFRLYKDLHPEDKDAKIEDIEIRTLESTFVNTRYNDLGFVVGNKLVMLVEAQSSWSENIPLRMFFYVCDTYRRYIDDRKMNEYRKEALKLPPAELYLVYTGPGKAPDRFSLKEICFDGLGSLDLEVTVLQKIDGTIQGEYVGFCKEFNEQWKKRGNSVECIQETIRICIEKGYLAEYLTRRQNEVITMIQKLFDEETQQTKYYESVANESRERGRKEGREEGREEGIEIGIEKGRLETLKENAKKLCRKGWSVEEIAEFIEIPVVDVEIWLSEE
ncbi:MAG: hypothetical protein J6X44_07060 [Thermoguttaceae bacterium]|nr:hypothetical protein [Thermoguttaceae bacterium]